MNCTDCTNTVPITDGAHPKYVRPNTVTDPLCRVCWEKAVEKYEAGAEEARRQSRPDNVT